MGQPYPVFKTVGTGGAPGDVDGVAVAATLHSIPWSTPNGDGFSLQAEWTGTSAGNLQLWYSNKPFPTVGSDTDWVQDLNFGTAGNVALGGAPGKYGDNVGNAKAKWWKFKLAGGGGSGVLKAWVIAARTA